MGNKNCVESLGPWLGKPRKTELFSFKTERENQTRFFQWGIDQQPAVTT